MNQIFVKFFKVSFLLFDFFCAPALHSMIACGNVDKAALGLLDTAALPFFAPIFDAITEF